MTENQQNNLSSAIDDIQDKITVLEHQLAALCRQRDALRECGDIVNHLSSINESLSVDQIGQKKVVIIGGNGGMGRLFSKMFKSCHYRVLSIDVNNQHELVEAVNNADLVLVCVPIDLFSSVIESLPPLSRHCVLADITSVKSVPMQAMMKAHTGPVLGLHPMFGPTVKDFKGQTFIACDGQMPNECTWVLEQVKAWGGKLTTTTAKEHDHAMSIVQALRHFSTFTYGLHLMSQDTDLDELMRFSSPIYRLELAMVGRLFAQDPHLYAHIIFNSEQTVETIKAYRDTFNVALDILEKHDKTAFVSQFNQVSEWLGDKAEEFLKESNALLEYAKHQETILKKNRQRASQLMDVA